MEWRARVRVRFRQCRAVTAFPDALAWPASPMTEAARNAMGRVAQPLNGAIFDAALALSLGDVPRSTLGHWMLEVADGGAGGST